LIVLSVLIICANIYSAEQAKAITRGFKIGICDWTLRMAADPNSLAMAAKLGLDGVQVDAGRNGDKLLLSDPNLQKKFLAMAKKHKVEIASLAIVALNDIPYKSDPLAEKWIEQAVEICRQMKVKVLLVPFFGNGDLRGDNKGIDVVVERLRKAATKAEKAGVIIGIESTLSAKEHIDIIKRVGSPAVKVYYDVFNSLMNGYDIYEEIRYLSKDNLCEFHAKDDLDLYGKGRLDFPKIRKAMDDIGCRGWIQIEGWKTPLGMEDSYRYDGEYLKKIFPRKAEMPDKDIASTRKGLTNPFFAMDTATRDANHITAKSQVELLNELGYEGICYWQRNPQSDINETAEMLGELDKNCLKAFGFYFEVNLDSLNDKYPSLLKETIELLKGRDSAVWISIRNEKYNKSSPEADDVAVAIIRQVADMAYKSGVKIALYPHAGFWMERVEDGVRVAEKVNRSNVGVCFNLCHWLMTDEEKNMESVLKVVKPYLFVVTINGADSGGRNWGQLIRPLDSGTFNTYKFLKTLKESGYKGPIGLQGYGVEGDVYENLKRAMSAWRQFSIRLSEEKIH